MLARRALAVTIIALSTVSCGSGTAAPDPVPATALPGEPGEPEEVDASLLASDAIDFAELEALLEDEGFAGGTQRVFAQSQGARQRRSLARVLSFTDADGAQTYLGWLEEHVEEVIGPVDLLDPPDLPGVAFLALSDSDCCPKATEVYLVAWRRDSTVVTLEVGGDGLDEGLVADLAQDLDAAVMP